MYYVWDAVLLLAGERNFKKKDINHFHFHSKIQYLVQFPMKNSEILGSKKFNRGNPLKNYDLLDF